MSMNILDECYGKWSSPEKIEFVKRVNNLEDQRNAAELRIIVADATEDILRDYAESALRYVESSNG